MITRDDWISVFLDESRLALGEIYAERFTRENAQRLNEGRMKPTRHAHTPDGLYETTLGLLGELAVRQNAGEPLPPIEWLVNWKGPDWLHYAIRTVPAVHYNLLWNDIDIDDPKHPERARATHFLLVARTGRRQFWILGEIEKLDARRLSRWGSWLPTPAWALEPEQLNPFSGPGCRRVQLTRSRTSY